VVPQDVIDRIQRGEKKPDNTPYTINDVTIRGGDLSVNPRVELRIPITDLFQTGVFLDAGNLWQDPSLADRFALRYGVGAGIRFTTPVGPIALDYGINPDRRRWEDFGAFHFSIGLF
jgi:outer membrane protein insertion porin family